MYFIGIDIGTSSVKVIAIDEKGEILASASRDYKLDFPQPLWVEQDPEAWWSESLDALGQVLISIDRTQVKSISLSGQMHGLVSLDQDGQVIRPAILWNDQRTQQECDYLNQVIGRDKLSGWTGNVAMTGLTAPKLLWLREHEGENFEKLEKILLPKDYIAYRLSGVFATDYSDASGTLYFDVEKKTWSQPMLEILGIKESQLPRLFDSRDSIGNIRKDLAQDLGLRPDVKIIIGGADQAMAAVGGGIVAQNQCSISLGTSGVVYSNSEKFLVDRNNRLHSFCNGSGSYYVMGVTLAAASSLKWWVEAIHKSQDYDGLLEEVAQADQNKNLYFLPYLTGERTPHNDPNAKGVFLGMDIATSRADMTRALIEGVAFSLRDSMEIVRDMGTRPDEITINGGGARSDIWCQLMADVMNIQVKKVNSNDGPAYGAAIMAAVGYGYFDSVDQACASFIRETKRYIPNEEKVELYDKKYEKYRKLYPNLKELFI